MIQPPKGAEQRVDLLRFFYEIAPGLRRRSERADALSPAACWMEVFEHAMETSSRERACFIPGSSTAAVASSVGICT
jgi:hypothetical protein